MNTVGVSNTKGLEAQGWRRLREMHWGSVVRTVQLTFSVTSHTLPWADSAKIVSVTMYPNNGV
jgi:hypothetical protein